MATAADVLNYLTSNRIEFKVITHPPFASAHDLARTHGLMIDEVAQTRVFMADRRFVIALVPGENRIDEQELCEVLEAREITAASDWDLERLFPGCEIGAAPPLGNLYGLPVVADRGFETTGRIVFSVCSRTISLMLDWREYKKLVHPIVAAIVIPAHVPLTQVP
jgi:Ala-tRNA(Pro) deacylase